ncbi:MAG: hypothetical protein L0Z62_04030 [Gemmataceae bacterium]|nr:hypothetical protein [Gemmataceae bacterium]
MAEVDWFKEPDWQRSVNPHHLRAILERQGVKSSRKFRLAAVACCRCFWDCLPVEHQAAIDASERYADKLVAYADLYAIGTKCWAVLGNHQPQTRAAIDSTHRQALIGFQGVLYHLLRCAWGGPQFSEPRDPGYDAAWEENCRRLCQIIRDIFGNPFCPAVADPTWLSWNGGAVVALAKAMYEDRRFEEMPLLADALEEAGCTDESILSHCRGANQHVRGCWVLDLLLGKN